MSSEDVEWTLHGYADLDPHQPVSPLMVFRACGQRPKCGNCIPLIARLIDEHRLLVTDAPA
jgi:bacterioferritin-associated ferredoxin